MGGTEFRRVLRLDAGPDERSSRSVRTLPGHLMELSFGSYHASGAQFVMGDGNVRFISDSIDAAVYLGLGSILGRPSRSPGSDEGATFLPGRGRRGARIGRANSCLSWPIAAPPTRGRRRRDVDPEKLHSYTHTSTRGSHR